MQSRISEQTMQLLQKCNNEISQKPLSELLDEKGRFDAFSKKMGGLMLDFSRVRIDESAFQALLRAARECELEEKRAALFAGDNVNLTEHRPALHMALRSPEVLKSVGGEEAARVEGAMNNMFEMADLMAGGVLPGPDGHRITDVVHVGIGGSFLGPRLLHEALAIPDAAIRVHFLGSVDAHSRVEMLDRLDPATTMVVLVSKSFTTGDTLLHGKRLRSWLSAALGQDEAEKRLFAVTSQVDRATAFGVDQSRMLYFSDWVGGRYSLWSPVSLAAVAAMGTDRFRSLLMGGADMDRHFQDAELADNLPVLTGLIGLWHRNICGYASLGVMPYDQRMRSLPAFLQQLIMESNGKSITVDGEQASLGTSPVIFGETGTDAQHSVFQAMHQGSDIVPLNFVAVAKPDHDDDEAHDELLANLLAQLTALANGRSREATRAENPGEDEVLLTHRTFDGNRPSELILMDRFSARNLGRLLAFYEHKTFVESVLYNINAFDQWGVELGKTLAPAIQAALAGEGTVEGLAPLLEVIADARARD